MCVKSLIGGIVEWVNVFHISKYVEFYMEQVL